MLQYIGNLTNLTTYGFTNTMYDTWSKTEQHSNENCECTIVVNPHTNKKCCNQIIYHCNLNMSDTNTTKFIDTSIVPDTLYDLIKDGLVTKI